MLKRSMKRKSTNPNNPSPKMAREQYYSRQGSMSSQGGPVPPSPSYDGTMQQPGSGRLQHPHAHPQHQQHPHQHQQMHQQHPQHQQQYIPGAQQQYPPNADYIWQGFEATASEQLPVWLSDQSLGGNSFSQNGMDAFLLPADYFPPPPQIW